MIKFILENFDTIFKNENSLETLNKIILDLAVKGKLVPQNENDEPAGKLLKRIQAEKERLIKEKIIKKEKPLPEITEEEIPFDIPKNWEWVRLGQVIKIARGGSPRPINSFLTNDKDGINWIKIGDTEKNSKYINSSKEKIIKEGIKNSRYVKKGDFLLTNSMSFGRPYILNINGCIHDGWLVISEYKKNYDKDFLYHMLSSNFTYSQFSNVVSGSVVKNLNTEKVINSIFPLPPLEEQKRIVEKVEKLQELIKNLKEIYSSDEKNRNNFKKSLLTEIEKSSDDTKLLNNLELVFNNFDKIVKTKEDIKDIRNLILSLAIKGKLVPQNENDEPAGELLKRIQAEKERLIKEKIIKKEKPLPEIIEEEIPFDIPKNWEWVRLRDIACINPKNIADDNVIASFIPMKLISDGYINKHSSENKFWKEIKNGFTHFQNEDIGIAKITPCFENRKSVIFKNLKNCIGAGTTELYIIRLFLKNIENKYLLNVFKTEDFIKKGVGTYTGTAGQQRVKREFIENYLIPLPPLEEQKRIVKKVENLMEICNLLEEKINISENISENLLKSFINNGE